MFSRIGTTNVLNCSYSPSYCIYTGINCHFSVFILSAKKSFHDCLLPVFQIQEPPCKASYAPGALVSWSYFPTPGHRELRRISSLTNPRTFKTLVSRTIAKKRAGTSLRLTFQTEFQVHHPSEFVSAHLSLRFLINGVHCEEIPDYVISLNADRRHVHGVRHNVYFGGVCRPSSANGGFVDSEGEYRVTVVVTQPTPLLGDENAQYRINPGFLSTEELEN